MILESKKTGQRISVTEQQYQTLKNSGQYRNFKVIQKEESVIIPETFMEVMNKVIASKQAKIEKLKDEKATADKAQAEKVIETKKTKNGRKATAPVLPDKSIQ